MPSTSTELSKKAGWTILEKIFMNSSLGFSNWLEIDIFEKENRFVKKLRNSMYKNGISKLVYQSLTKKEKKNIGAYFSLKGNGHDGVGGLIDLSKFQSSARLDLSMDFSVDDSGVVVAKLVHKSSGNVK